MNEEVRLTIKGSKNGCELVLLLRNNNVVVFAITRVKFTNIIIIRFVFDFHSTSL